MRKNEVKSLLETRDAMECLCLRLVCEKNDVAELEKLSPILDSIRDARNADEAAERVFSFHHELAIMSGNVLLPLLYYSFKTQGEYLWSLYCKRSGVKKLYEIKLALFSALMNKDIDSAIEQTHRIMDVAKERPRFLRGVTTEKARWVQSTHTRFFLALFPALAAGVVYVVFAAQQYFRYRDDSIAVGEQ